MPSLFSLRRIRLLAAAFSLAFLVHTGAASAAAPGFVSRAPGYMDVFQRNPQNGHLMHSFYATGNGGWSSWDDMSRSTGSNLVLAPDTDIATTLRPGGPAGVIIDVFFRSDSNSLWSIEWTGSGWTSMFQIPTDGQLITRGPAATSRTTSTRIDLFFGYLAGSTQGHVGNMTWTGGSWTGIAPIAGDILGGTGPAVASNADGSYDLVYTGTDQQVYAKNLRAGNWNANDPHLGTTSDGSVGGSVRNRGTDPQGRMDFLVREPTGGLRLTTWRNGSYSGWVPLDGSIKPATGPAVLWSKATDGADRLDVVTYRPDGGLQLRTYRDDSGWTNWVNLAYSPTSWTYGGPDLTVNTADEADAVISALRAAGSDAAAGPISAGLTPTDQTYVSQRLQATTPTSGTYGGTDAQVDTGAEAAALTAALDGGSPAVRTALWNGLTAAERGGVPYLDPSVRYYDSETAAGTPDDMPPVASGASGSSDNWCTNPKDVIGYAKGTSAQHVYKVWNGSAAAYTVREVGFAWDCRDGTSRMYFALLHNTTAFTSQAVAYTQTMTRVSGQTKALSGGIRSLPKGENKMTPPLLGPLPYEQMFPIAGTSPSSVGRMREAALYLTPDSGTVGVPHTLIAPMTYVKTQP